MQLYHFTNLELLLGADGVAALQNCAEGGSVNAAPGSILVEGLLPRREEGGYDHMLRAPLPPCVWLTENPQLTERYNNHFGFRIALTLPSERRLARWPDYLRKHARGDADSDFWLRLTEADRAEGHRFYVFFGRIAPERFKAIEAQPVRDESRIPRPAQTARPPP